jgi:hypothetical protein
MANSRGSPREKLLFWIGVITLTVCFYLYMERSLVIDENGKDCPLLTSTLLPRQSEDQKEVSGEGNGRDEIKHYFRFRSWWSYHWEYLDGSQDYRFRLTCPTQVKNVNLYYRNQLVAQSEAKVFRVSDKEKYHIYDCQGNLLFIITSGGFFGKMFTPQDYVLEDKDGNVLSFIKTTNFIHSFANYVITKPSGGEVIGRVRRFFFRNNFEISLVSPNDPGVDLRALGLLFSQKSFLNFGPKHRDYCNTIGNSSVVTIFVVVTLILGFLVRNRMNRS